MRLNTTDDLLQFLYEGTSDRKSNKVDQFLLEDAMLHEEFEDLEHITEALDDLLESPRPQSVMAILNYAKHSTPVA